jgi:hypothetical protein
MREGFRKNLLFSLQIVKSIKFLYFLFYKANDTKVILSLFVHFFNSEWMRKQNKIQRKYFGSNLHSPAHAEPEFVNVYGAQESIPRNQIHQPM